VVQPSELRGEQYRRLRTAERPGSGPETTLGLFVRKAASGIPKSKSCVKTIQPLAAAKSMIPESATVG
jgi:hypothetical protein